MPQSPAPRRVLRFQGRLKSSVSFNIQWRQIMARTINCVKLKREAEGLDFPPYPGELGTRIWREVSKDAWE